MKSIQLCQIEIYVGDLPKALAFYEHVFGWKAVPADIHGVTVLSVPANSPFGISLISRKESKPAHNNIVIYFAVESPAKIAEAAEKFGGKKRFGPKKIGGYGTIFQIEDPDGIRWGLFCQASPKLPQNSIHSL